MKEPYFENESVKIYCADSQNLDFIPDNSVHLIITSPPYNVGKEYSKHNDRMDLDNYYTMLHNVFKECYRVLVSGGRIAVNVPSCLRMTTFSKVAYIAIDVYLMLKEIGFKERDFIGWVKIPPITNEEDYKEDHRHYGWERPTSWGSWLSCSDPAVRDNMEYIIVMHKETPRLDGNKEDVDITKEEFMKYTYNAWFILPVSKMRKWHPAAFPDELPYRLMKLYSYRGNTVLDPFAGSGTVGGVARKIGRKAILVDIDRKYCELAKANCSQEVLF